MNKTLIQLGFRTNFWGKEPDPNRPLTDLASLIVMQWDGAAFKGQEDLARLVLLDIAEVERSHPKSYPEAFYRKVRRLLVSYVSKAGTVELTPGIAFRMYDERQAELASFGVRAG